MLVLLNVTKLREFCSPYNAYIFLERYLKLFVPSIWCRCQGSKIPYTEMETKPVVDSMSADLISQTHEK